MNSEEEGLQIGNLLRTDIGNVLPPEFISSLLAMLIVIVLVFVVYFKGKKYGPFDKPKGIVNAAETLVEFAENKVSELMGKSFLPFTGYVIGLGLYIFISFLVGMAGIPNPIVIGDDAILNSSWLFKPLPNPFTNLAFPLSIALLTILLIQYYGIKYKHAKYLMKFVSPIPFIELISMWIPMLSLTLRLFGNAFAGFCLITLAYYALDGIAGGFGLVLGPALMPIAHAYFDVFDGLIQTVVFLMVTMLNIAQEGPEEEAIETTQKITKLSVEGN